MSHKIVLEYMFRSDIFSLPSWNEGFGIVYIEAMAFAKPIIACRDQGIADVIEHKKTGMLVKSKDANSIVEAMEYLIQNPVEVQKMGNQAKIKIKSRYTWGKNVSKTIGIYEKAIQHFTGIKDDMSKEIPARSY